MAAAAARKGASSLTLEIYEGITEHANRVALKGVFSAFGDVLACWVPPIDRRGVDHASVRFATAIAAEAAKQACDAGQVFFQGLPVRVKWRVGGGPRVGNSDIGSSVQGRSPSRERDKWRQNRAIEERPAIRGGRSRSRRRRSRSRERGRRSRSRGRRRSRSRENRFGDVRTAALADGGLGPGSLGAPPWFLGEPPFGTLSGVLAGALPTDSSIPAVHMVQDAATVAAAAAEAEAESQKRKEAAKEEAKRRTQALKRGPGVAALVQGALKRAQTLVKDKEEERERDEEDDREEKAREKQARKDESSDEDEDDDAENEKRRKIDKSPEELQAERAKAEEEARVKVEQEEREKEERARKEAEEAEARLKLETAHREARVKVGVETAKRQQAARERRNVGLSDDNLYADMPQPNVENESVLNEKRALDALQLQKNINLSLPPEDHSKIVFLDVDGVLRPARAGGFDILSVDGAQAVHPDTSDFFPSAMQALRHIIERTGATIVLSSEWRRNETLREAVDNVLESARLRVCYSATRSDLERDLGTGDPVRSFAARRAREISSWLREHEDEVKGWVVLDDINLAIADEDRKGTTKSMGTKLVQTWPLCGLTMGNAKTAVRILNGEMIHKVLVERPKAPGGGINTPLPASAGGGAATPLPVGLRH